MTGVQTCALPIWGGERRKVGDVELRGDGGERGVEGWMEEDGGGGVEERAAGLVPWLSADTALLRLRPAWRSCCSATGSWSRCVCVCMYVCVLVFLGMYLHHHAEIKMSKM